MTDFVKQMKEWQAIIAEHKPPEPKITQIRIHNAIPNDKYVLIGKHLYMSEAGFQALGAEKGSSADIGKFHTLTGIPVLREYPPEELCPSCGWNEFKLMNYSSIWHDGDLCCEKCGQKIRDWDAG